MFNFRRTEYGIESGCLLQAKRTEERPEYFAESYVCGFDK